MIQHFSNSVIVKCNPNESDDLFNEKLMKIFRNIIMKRKKQGTQDVFFTDPWIEKLRDEPNYLSGEDWHLKTLFMNYSFY